MTRTTPFARPFASPAAAALLASLALAAAAHRDDEPWKLETPAPVVALRPAVVEGVESHACVACHRQAVEEWAASAHGIAWSDEVYQDALKGRKRPGFCHGCHAPEALLEGDGSAPVRPRAREDVREHGVSCEACHATPDGAFAGPTGAPTEDHATVASNLLGEDSSVLCAACHDTNIGPVIGLAKDFEESEQAKRGRSCVGCHMAERTVEGSERVVRSHALQTPRDPSFARRAFELSLDGTRVVVRNRAGHRVPGLIGREFRFRAEVLDASGEVRASGELVIDASAYLPVDGTKTIDVGQRGAAVRVVADHVDPRASEPIRILDERLEPDQR